MEIFKTLDELSPEKFDHPFVTIGVFDGLHVGHKEILRILVEWACRYDGQPTVVTFDRHPQALLSDDPPPMITSLDYRLRYFEKAGVANTVVLPFDEELANLSAEAFVQRILAGRIGLEAMLLGFDTRFGKGGEGDFKQVAIYSEVIGFQIRRAPVIEIDGERVSSSLVRKAISSGDLEKAKKLLGRNVTLEGRVIEGFGRGRKLGYPTANLELTHDVRPPAGVYGGKAKILEEDREFAALVSIGRHPTFGGNLPEDLVEVLLLDFDGDLVGRTLLTEVESFIREQRSFENGEGLKEQIARDVEKFVSGEKK